MGVDPYMRRLLRSRRVRRATARLRIGALCLVGICAGCTSQQQGGTPAPATSGTPETHADAAPAPAADTLGWTIEPVEQQRPALDPAVLQEVRAAMQPTFDRVVFEFQPPAVPGYRVAYVQPPAHSCGSGDAIDVEGAALLVVRLSPSQAHTETGSATAGPRERRPRLPVVRELERSCDFEGEVSWVLGLSAPASYRVSELTAPPRLVVDIQHRAEDRGAP
jgi:hypothetical protein